MNRVKRLFGIGGILVLILVLLVMTASAETNIVDQGQCGDQVYWTLDDQGLLTISGNGEMSTDINWNWNNQQPNIITVKITDGVTNISNYAFDRCTSLTSVSIPSSVKSINSYAFRYCTSLKYIYIPSSVTKLYTMGGEGPFTYCSNSSNSLVALFEADKVGDWSVGWNYGLSECYFGATAKDMAYWTDFDNSQTDVVIPEGVTVIPSDTFNNCTNLSTIIIPDSVKSIGSYAFNGCSSLKTVIIPDSVEQLGGYAFSGCSNLASVVVSNKVRGINNGVFNGCSKLNSITIGRSVTRIGIYAFRDCTSLKSVLIPESVVSIERNAFYACTSLRKINIPAGLTTIAGTNATDSPFYSCSSSLVILCENEDEQDGWGQYWSNYNSSQKVRIQYGIPFLEAEFWTSLNEKMTNIEIPSGIKAVPSMAFSGYTMLNSITIPASVANIGSYAFSSCNGLTEIHVESLESWLKIEYTDNNESRPTTGSQWNLYVDGNLITNLIIPKGVTNITKYAFRNCCSINSLDIANDVTSIEPYAFYHCNSLKKVTIGGNVASIEKSAFFECPAIETLIIGDNVKDIKEYAFYSCSSLKSVIFGQNVSNIGQSAFALCSSLKQVYLPATLTQIPASSYSYGPFYSCSSSLEIFCEANEKPEGWGTYWNYYSQTGKAKVYWGLPSGDALYWMNLDKSASNIEIPYGVTMIPASAFANCYDLVSITIPNSVTYIGDAAFWCCFGLRNVMIPEGLISIGERAFSDCASLKCIYIPASVTRISASNFTKSLFYGCSPSLVILCGADNAQDGWDKDWTYTTEYTTPYYGITPYEAEYWMNLDRSVTNIEIPNGITTIIPEAFSNCTSLTAVKIPDSVVTIGANAFKSCISLQYIYIPSSVAHISASNYANSPFDACTSSLVIFSGAKGPGASGWGKYWNYRTSNSMIPVNYNMTRLDAEYWMNLDKNATEVEIPYGVSTIPDKAFYYRGLRSVSIPDSVERIGSNAFCGCNCDISLPKGIQTVGSNAFSGKISCQSRTETSRALGIAGYQYCDIDHPEFTILEKQGITEVVGYKGNTNSLVIPDGYDKWNMDLTMMKFTSIRMPSTLDETSTYTIRAQCITIPDGVSALGKLALYNVNSLYIPASVTDLSSLTVTPGIPKVYCYTDSEAEYWAIVNGYDVVYMDGLDWDDIGELIYTGPKVQLDIGETIAFSPSDFLLMPIPPREIELAISATEADLMVEGLTVKGLIAGDYTISAMAGGCTTCIPIHVYQPVTDFSLSANHFVQSGKSFSVAIEDIVPQDNSGIFTWQQDQEESLTDKAKEHFYVAPMSPVSTEITVTSPNGLQRSAVVHIVSTVSAPYCLNNRNAVVGSDVGIYVDADGITYLNEPSLYGKISIPSSAEGILELTADNRVHVIGAGRTAFSVTGLDGKSVNIIVVASEVQDTLELPEGIDIVEDEAFRSIATQRVVISQGCEKIGKQSFADCCNLALVEIPDSICDIADDAFSGSFVTIICPPNSYAAQWCQMHNVSYFDSVTD